MKTANPGEKDTFIINLNISPILHPPIIATNSYVNPKLYVALWIQIISSHNQNAKAFPCTLNQVLLQNLIKIFVHAIVNLPLGRADVVERRLQPPYKDRAEPLHTHLCPSLTPGKNIC